MAKIQNAINVLKLYLLRVYISVLCNLSCVLKFDTKNRTVILSEAKHPNIPPFRCFLRQPEKVINSPPYLRREMPLSL